ncbi:hypothetical protein [Streptomyces lydicus]|uniref:hypothetical protein n=1 Tax=Streptomyces lydicus TaxID=47763 RepID=UPI0036EE46A0
MKHSPVREQAVRLATVLEHAFPATPPIDPADTQEIGALELLLLTPNDLRAFIEDRYAVHALRVRVTGTLDRRLVLLETGGGWWTMADLSGQPHANRAWPEWTRSRLLIDQPDSCTQPGRPCAAASARAAARTSSPSPTTRT